jgi:hypothetical protein
MGDRTYRREQLNYRQRLAVSARKLVPLSERHQKLNRTVVTLGRFIDHLLDNHQLLGRLLPAPVLIYYDRLSESTSTRLAKFLEPGGRPLGFPERPFLNRVCRGGLR